MSHSGRTHLGFGVGEEQVGETGCPTQSNIKRLQRGMLSVSGVLSSPTFSYGTREHSEAHDGATEGEDYLSAVR